MAWGLAAILMVAVIGGAGWMTYQKKPAAERRQAFSAYLAEVKTWFVERRNRFRHDVTQVKQLTAGTNEPEAPVHFEFYNTLSQMQVTVGDVSGKGNPHDKAAEAVPPRAKLNVSNANDLELDLLSKLHTK